MTLRGVSAIDPAAVHSFAARLERFASQLDEREQAILAALVHAALPPLERMQRREPEEVLSEEERAVLDRLLGREPPQP
jgi:hypothetical protein